mmetsp:Transcript_10734/g.22809  ORF Transcript_10734/g.22809 Transcript_10734/m.22809 type:complete len:103 (-) Transcript_10734:630-938(-)
MELRMAQMAVKRLVLQNGMWFQLAIVYAKLIPKIVKPPIDMNGPASVWIAKPKNPQHSMSNMVNTSIIGMIERAMISIKAKLRYATMQAYMPQSMMRYKTFL